MSSGGPMSDSRRPIMNPSAIMITAYFSVLSLSLALMDYKAAAVGALVVFRIYTFWAIT